MRRTTMCLAIVVFLAAACAGEDGTEPAAEVSPSPITSTSPDGQDLGTERCPDQGRVASDVSARISNVQTGSIVPAGDGSDRVWLARDESAAPPCSLFVVVETGDGGLIAGPASDREHALLEPRISGLYDLDGDGWNEILVDLEAGASTQFVGIFKVEDDRVERVDVPGDQQYGGLFPYGGSVGHIEASNCLAREPGRLVVSVALPFEDGYEVTRSFYEFEGSRLRRVERERVEVSPAEVGDLPEYRSSPFGSCVTSVVQE